jgi:hypothetical protein
VISLSEKIRVSPRAIVVGVILSIIISIWVSMNWNVTLFTPHWNVGGWDGSVDSTYGRHPESSPYAAGWGRFITGLSVGSLLLFIVTLINMFKPVFGRSDIAVVYMMVFASCFMNSMGWANSYNSTIQMFFTYGWMGVFSTVRAPPPDDAAKIVACMADIMGCGKDKDYWNMVLTTWWSPVRWDYILPMVLWGGALLSVLCLLGVSIALLTRRLYVDVEALHFQISEISRDLIDTTQRADGKPKFFNKFFLIGFLIQFIWIAIGNWPWDIWMFFSAGPAPWGSARARFGDIYIYPVYDATQLALLPWVPLPIHLHPWLIAWGALLPIDVLIGSVIGWLIFLVLIPIIYTVVLGLWTPMPTGQWGYIVNRIYYALVPGGTPNVGWIIFGGILALAIFPIVRNIGTMGPIFKAAIGKEPPEEFDPDRPVKYVVAFWMLVASIILYVLLAAVANVMPIWSLLWILILTLMMIGTYRYVAETGGYLGVGWGHSFHFSSWPQQETAILLATLNPIAPITGVPPTKETVMTYTFISYGMSADGVLSMTPFSAGYITLESFKLAKSEGIRLRDITIAVLIALIVTMFAQGFGTFFWNIVFPADKFTFYPAVGWLGSGFFALYHVRNIATGVPYSADLSRYNNLVMNPGPTDAVIKIVIGAAMVIGLMLARERFPWLRISAAGIILGADFGAKFWAPFLVGLAIKYVTLRVGGVKLFVEKIRPIMMGFLYGFGLANIIHLIIFVPAFTRINYGLL